MFKIYILINFLLNNVVFCDRKINFRTTSLKCEHDPSLYNGTTNCFIKPFRNGTRLSTIEYNFRKPCYDFWIHMQFHYKFGGSGKYRQWMFDNDEFLCGYYTGANKPGLFFGLVKIAIEHVSPRTLHACPYLGVEGVTAIDIDDIISNAIPAVIPTGDYRIVIRFHTTSNKTFLKVTIGGRFDAIKPLEAVRMG